MPKKAISMGVERLRGLVAGAMEQAGPARLVKLLGRDGYEAAIIAIVDRLDSLEAKPSAEELADEIRQAVDESAPEKSERLEALNWVYVASLILVGLDLPSGDS